MCPQSHAGRPPFDASKLDSTGFEAALRTLRESEPPRPGTRFNALKPEERAAVAAQRSESPAQLVRQLRGELDWFLLKALEKDRARRYGSANDLVADLQRYLEHEPVSAPPLTMGYRFTKFARKNRVALATAVAFLAVLVAGIITTGWQALRATRHLGEARLNAYASEMNVAQQALAENNLERALQLLDRQRPKRGEEDLRGFEWRYLWQLCRGERARGASRRTPCRLS